MARDGRTAADVRRDLAAEREELADAVEELRRGVHEATDVKAKLRSNLPAATGGALGLGFIVAGGIGATMRLLARKGREPEKKVRFGRFSFIDRS